MRSSIASMNTAVESFVGVTTGLLNNFMGECDGVREATLEYYR